MQQFSRNMNEQPNTTDTVLAVRIPEIQRDKIRQAAKIEQRTESGFARYHLAIAAEEAIAAAQTEEEAK